MPQELLASGEFAGLLPEACDAEIVNTCGTLTGFLLRAMEAATSCALTSPRGKRDCWTGVITHSHEPGEHRLLARSLAQFLEQLAEQLRLADTNTPRTGCRRSSKRKTNGHTPGPSHMNPGSGVRT